MPPRESHNIPQAVEALTQLLRQHLDVHRALMECIGRKREAIRKADLAVVSAISKQEAPMLTRLSELEKKRAALIGQLSAALRPPETKTKEGTGAGTRASMTVKQIATAAGEARGRELLAVAVELKALATSVQRANSIVRDAADALARHMAGVMQTVGSALSSARVYGRRGQVALGAQMHFSVDMKS